MTIPSISDAEWEVMSALWDSGEPGMAAREVVAVLSERKAWAASTVKTLLQRLAAKGVITHEQIGNSFLYRAACSRSEVTKREVAGFVERVFGGSFSPLLAHFIENEPLTDEEIESLRTILEKRGK